MSKIHELLLNNSARVVFVEQLLKGEGYFMSLHGKVSIETHVISDLNGTQCKLKLKQILTGEGTKPAFLS